MNFIQKIKNADRIQKSGYINMGIRPLSLVVSLLYTPVLLSYLGDEKYGLWATVLSIISWINYFDVGIGNGLRNLLPKYLIKEDYQSVKRAVSTSYIVLSGITSVFLIVLIVVSFILNWHTIFSTEIDMRLTMAISFVFICFNFVLSLGNTLLYTLQLSERVAIRNLSAQILNLLGVVVLNLIFNPSLVLVAIVFGLSQLVVNLVNTFELMRKRSYFRPSFKFYDKTLFKSIFSVGLRFFVIQIMCLAMFTVDDLLITHFWGASANTPFSICNKLFNTLYSVFAAFTVPYWSGTTKAVSLGDYKWIIKSIKSILKVFLLFVIIYVIGVILFKPVVRIWLRKDLAYQNGLIPLMCCFYILYSILNIECQFLNGMNSIKVQTILYVFSGVLNVPFSILLGVVFNLQSVGIRLATFILVLIMDVVLGIDLKNKLSSMKREVHEL